MAHESDSKQHARSSRPAAEATAGEAMDLDGLSTAAGTAPPPLAHTHGPAAEILHEGAEHDAETGNAAGGPGGSGGGGSEATKTKLKGRHVRQPAEELVQTGRQMVKTEPPGHCHISNPRSIGLSMGELRCPAATNLHELWDHRAPNPALPQQQKSPPRPRPGPHHPRTGAPRRQRRSNSDGRCRPGRPLLLKPNRERSYFAA